jgi:maltooligosyltrehalose trehalohydrolase
VGLPPTAFVTFLENHDQVANSARGDRLHQQCDPARYRALTALLLLAPSVPLLFQGQEFGSTAPFLFFADHDGDLALAVRDGRRDFLRQFVSLAQPDLQQHLPDPSDPATFTRCQLDDQERSTRGPDWHLHRDLLALRRSDPTIRALGARGIDGAVVGEHAFVVRFFGATPSHDRLLVLNLGSDIREGAIAEPLVAPPADFEWTLLWSSEDPLYGGHGIAHDINTRWLVPAQAALLFKPEPTTDIDPARR